jgi:Na+/pantothenate symporter
MFGKPFPGLAQPARQLGKVANMPTDLDPAFARKRAAQAQTQTQTTMLSFWLIICLGMIGLLFELFGRHFW